MKNAETGGATVTVQPNPFGPFIGKSDIPAIRDRKKSDKKIQFERQLLEAFFDLPLVAISEKILNRYVEATTKKIHIAVAPHTERIYARLLKPLRSAKKSYCLGDYGSTIALCGTAGEMLAIFIWKINEIKLNGRQMNKTDEEGLFGRRVEMLSQKKRLEVLKTFRMIDGKQLEKFEEIKNIRRQHLHFWDASVRGEKGEALKVLKKCLQLFKEITGIGFAEGGKVKIDPKMLKHFEGTKD